MSTSIHYDQFEKLESEMIDADKTTFTLDNDETKFTLDNALLCLTPNMKVKYTGIDYKYNEGELLGEIRSYINATYDQHYSHNKFQATEFIIDGGHGTGFNVGNMMKYTQRYGRKGDPAEWRKDLMKVIHYAIIQLYVHDQQHKKV